MPDQRSPWRLAAPAIFVLAGLLFVTSAHAARGGDLRAGRRTELADLIRAEDSRVDARTRQVEQLRGAVDALSGAAAEPSSQRARRRTERLQAPVGLSAVSGPALTVSLDDAPRRPGEELPEGAHPDDVVVHQQDVQAAVNAMWAGGAEAMQLMDQRVISTSAVRCVGNTLILQGRVYSPPFTITAVGDVGGMRAALDSSREVDIFRQYVDAYGLGYSVKEHRSARLPAYTGSLDLRYAEVAGS